EQPDRAHLTEDLGVGVLVAERLEHAGGEFLLRVLRRGVANHPLVVGELLIKVQRVVPGETGCHDSSLSYDSTTRGRQHRVFSTADSLVAGCRVSRARGRLDR